MQGPEAGSREVRLLKVDLLQVSETKNVVDRQSCASAGQGVLQSMYHMMFKRMQLNSSQVLITQDDLQVRHRYQMLMDTLDKLAELGSVPIINENDVVTGGSWGTTPYFTDNDKLSAILAAGSDADGLALLTDVRAPPALHPLLKPEPSPTLCADARGGPGRLRGCSTSRPTSRGRSASRSGRRT
jgi:glutamate 5-kinase